MKNIKIVRSILLVLIIIGIGLLCTLQLWVPPLVATILSHEGTPHVPDTNMFVPKNATTTRDGMEKWNWMLSEKSPQGVQFLYPNPLPTQYITAQEWPPLVEIATSTFSCIEGNSVAADGSPHVLVQHMISNHVYCVGISAEGAAGSTYTQYTYTTPIGTGTAHITFTLRTPQCMNYDDPEQSVCKTEQSHFAVDALAHRIATSIQEIH
jgi:hypothetical protein